MKIIFLLGIVFNILWSWYALNKTQHDTAFMTFHVYLAALLVVGYVEFK